MILTAAVALLLKKYTGGEDIILGTQVLKQAQEAEFINTVLPLRLAMPEEASFKELILAARQTIEEATQHKNYPLRLLLEQLGAPVDAVDFPLFEVAVLLENIHDQRYIDYLSPRLTFAFRRQDESLLLRLDYDAARYDAASMVRLGQHFACLLARAVADISLSVAALDPIPADERRLLLAEFNATAGAYPAGRTVAQLFAAQAAATPQAVAVVHGERSLTFAEIGRAHV
jgi:non-ribosomal peptide synthetase component F